MNGIQTWDYAASVERVWPMVVSWRSLTVELVDELYRAREALDGRGKNRGNQNVTDVTFSSYLNDVGLNRMTVHRWLERYVPEERKLLTPEELEQRKSIETRAAQDAAVARRARVNEALNTGRKPDDWDEATDRAYQEARKEREDRDRRIQAAMDAERLREKQDQEKRERERVENEKIDADYHEAIRNLLGAASSPAIQAEEKRKTLKQKMRLSDAGANDVFIDSLLDYLEELENDSRRLEACNNIIKVCRNVAAELQGR